MTNTEEIQKDNTTNNDGESNVTNSEKTETITNTDGSTTTTVTNTDGTTIKTTINTDGSKEITTTKTDGSEYKTEISSDWNTTTTTEIKSPIKTVTNTDGSTTTSTSTEEEEVDTRTAVEKIKGTSTYAPNETIGKNCNIEIDGFQFVAEEINLSESYPRRNLIRTNIMGGGQQTSKGEYVPRSFTFNTNINYPTNQPDAYDKLWEYMNNKDCKIVCQYTGDMMAEVQIQKTYPKGMGNTVKLSITVTEISQNDNTYTVKTDMGNFTTITDNTTKNIKQMEDEDGNMVTIQTNISEKHTTDMSKNLKEIEKEDKDKDNTIKITDTAKTTQADSTKNNNNPTNTSSSTTITTTDTTTENENNTVNTNNNNDYVSRDVTVNI